MWWSKLKYSSPCHNLDILWFLPQREKIIDEWGEKLSFRNGKDDIQYTLIKNKIKFPHILGNSEWSGAKSYMTNDLLIYGENICAFPHILGSPSLYMTLHPVPSEFPYIYEENFVFFFISVPYNTKKYFFGSISYEGKINSLWWSVIASNSDQNAWYCSVYYSISKEDNKEQPTSRNLSATATSGGFIKGILRGVRCTKSLRVLFLHRRSPS